MENLFVSYETALKLKQLGFDENCFAKYNSKKQIDYFERPKAFYCVNSKSSWFSPIFSSKETVSKVCTAPTHQQVIDWFRDKHKLHFYIVPYGDGESWTLSNIGRTDKTTNNGRLFYEVRDKYDSIKFKTYYEALDKAIDEALKLINDK
jgi:hypothetical protein